MREAVRAGLDRVDALVPGHGFANLTAGVNQQWGGQLGAFVEAEVGFKPRENVDLFAFGKADLAGASAGLGARLTF